MHLHRIAGALLAASSLLSAPASAAVLTTSVAQTTLVDQNARTFSLQSLRGTPLVIAFVAAHCTDACPLINAHFARAAALLHDKHIGVRLLTITLDPEHDSLRDMQNIAATFSANRAQWIVASGSVAHVHTVMRGFGVIAQRGKDGYADVHSTFIYLLDRNGRVVRTDLASTDLADQIVSDVISSWHALSV